MELFGAKRPRSKHFGKDINLPKESPRSTRPAPRPTGAVKKAAGATARLKVGISRLKGNR